MDTIQDSLKRLYEGDFKPTSWESADFRFITVHLIERSVALLSQELSGELLDVGCGTQPYNLYFKHVTKKTNCDYDATRGQVDFTCSATAIPVPNESYDSILCTEVLEHVPDPGGALKEFNRVLRPGGKILLSTPMYWPSHEVPYDFYRFPEHGLRYLTEQAGFEMLAMIPRGGIFVFLGQIVLMVLAPLFPFAFQRKIWNRLMLFLDRVRCSPRLTIGWTILARKIAPVVR